MLEGLGSFVILMGQTGRALFRRPVRIQEILEQLYFVANQSTPVISVCVSFAAMVTIIESAFHIKLVVQNIALVPAFAALLILRELGAVLAALLLTSRVGAGMAAEVGTMTITEQIDALRMLGISPIHFLVVPRFVASVIGGVLLSIVANTVCLSFAIFVSWLKYGVSFGSFISAMHAFVKIQDLYFAMIKGGIFGAVIPLVACFYGLRCKAGAEGVGKATTNSVVTSSVVIIGLDFVLTWIFSHFY